MPINTTHPPNACWSAAGFTSDTRRADECANGQFGVTKPARRQSICPVT